MISNHQFRHQPLELCLLNMTAFELEKTKLPHLSNDPTEEDSHIARESAPAVRKLLQAKIKDYMKTKTFLVLFILTAGTTLIIGTGAIFGISWGASGAVRRASRPTIATNQYTPGDTRLHTFPSFFCSAVSLEVDASIGASAYLVDTPPQLSENRTGFSFTYTVVYRPNEYKHWQYYLYPNSSIHMVVLSDEMPARSILVKGKENASRFADFYLFGNLIREYVSPGIPVDLIYRVTEEDEYYIVIKNDNETAPSIIGAQITIIRSQYEVPSNADESTWCQAVSSTGDKAKCRLDIPYTGATSSQSVLVAVSAPANVSWIDGVNLSVDCVRRDWAYAVVIVCPLIVAIFVIAVFILSVAACCKCYIKKLKAEYV